MCREKKRSVSRAALKRLWTSTKTFLYPRVKLHRRKQKQAAESESKGLTAWQVADAETPRAQDQDITIHVTGDGTTKACTSLTPVLMKSFPPSGQTG